MNDLIDRIDPHKTKCVLCGNWKHNPLNHVPIQFKQTRYERTFVIDICEDCFSRVDHKIFQVTLSIGEGELTEERYKEIVHDRWINPKTMV